LNFLPLSIIKRTMSPEMVMRFYRWSARLGAAALAVAVVCTPARAAAEPKQEERSLKVVHEQIMLPALDREAPVRTETATFALG
jgi:hypothetical protein